MAMLAVFLIVAAAFSGAEAAWCVCNGNAGTGMLQKTIDYACGAGADCSPILQKGSCYEPNTVLAHCSYAVNSYFQRKGQSAGSCDFSGTAGVTASDPSYSGCSFPSSASSVSTPSSINSPPGITTTTGGTPGFSSPTITGINGGLGPAGTGISTDGAGALGFSPAVGFSLLIATVALLRNGW